MLDFLVALESEPQNPELYQKLKDRALGTGAYSYAPYSCFISYKTKEEKTGIEFRDCVVDYTKCPNHNCIKKLV